MPTDTARRILLLLTLFLPSSLAQTPASPTQEGSPQQLAKIIGIDQLLQQCAALDCHHKPAGPPTVEQFAVRQQITEGILAASLDVDSALAEIASEHARLMELSSLLQAKRDRAVGLTSVANLIVGTGIGIAVNALQFKDATAIVGDGIGVGSGVASTVLSVIGIRLNNGPQQGVIRSPNMLAVLLDRQPVLHSDYPNDVLAYLKAVPEGEPASQGTRLEQLQREWQTSGRLGKPNTPAAQKKIDRLTSSLDASRRLSIADITDRMHMLQDVAGRVALMKRDLADLMRGALRPSDIR